MKTSMLFTALAACFGLSTVAFASAILTLTPANGQISGTAGSIIGWGFSLSNASDFAVITSSNFCLGSSGVTSLCIAPTVGSYTDDLATNYTIAGPAPESPVVTQAFSSTLGTGVGSFSISSGEPVGATDAGQLVLTYDLYSVDPLSPAFDPVTDLISAGNFLIDPTTVTLITSAPEPSAWLLVAMAGSLILYLRRSK